MSQKEGGRKGRRKQRKGARDRWRYARYLMGVDCLLLVSRMGGRREGRVRGWPAPLPIPPCSRLHAFIIVIITGYLTHVHIGGRRACPFVRWRLLARYCPSLPPSHPLSSLPCSHTFSIPPFLPFTGTMVWPVSLWTAEYIHHTYRKHMRGARVVELGCGW